MAKGKTRSVGRLKSQQSSHQATAAFQRALAAHQEGQLARAEAAYREALAAQPGYVDALMFLGHLYVQQGCFRQAGETTQRAIALNPDHPVAHFNLGMARLGEQRYEEALASFDRAIALYPDYPEALNNRGSVLQSLGRHPEAIACFDQALAVDPQSDFAYSNRGISQQQLGLHAEAIASFEQALGLANENAAAHNNRGVSLIKLGRHDEAIAALARAIALEPEYMDAMINQAIALSYHGQAAAAVAIFDQVLMRKPDSVVACNNRGMALLNLGRSEEALASFDRASALAPDYFDAYNNRGLALENLRRYEDALASYSRALALRPDDAVTHVNRGLALLRQGDFSAGWREFEHRWQTEQYRSVRRDFPQPLWHGQESVAGRTILLHGEQGLGDTLQFCRYAKQVAALGATVVLEVQPGLAPALSGLEGVAQVLTRGEPLPAFDVHCPLLSLPLAFATELHSVPAATAYLSADPDRVAAWRSRLGENARSLIGLVWSGSATFGNDHNRSMALAHFADLQRETVQWVSLQKEIKPADKAAFDARDNLRHFGEELRDFADTAALIELMAMVITVDTAVAHLAGALGKTVWLLLPFNADWRWLSQRDDSPWYPSMKLFRQPRAGDWHSVITAVATALAAASFAPLKPDRMGA